MINQEEEEFLDNSDKIKISPIIDDLLIQDSKITQNNSNEIIFNGLPSKYYPFLKDLIEYNSISKNEFENICRNYRFMFGTTIDEINTWSDDKFGDYFFENYDENDLSFNSEIKKKIMEKINDTSY